MYVCMYIYILLCLQSQLPWRIFYQFCHRVASKHIYYCMTTVQPKSMCKQPCMSVKKEIIYKMNKNEKNHRKQLKKLRKQKKISNNNNKHMQAVTKTSAVH